MKNNIIIAVALIMTGCYSNKQPANPENCCQVPQHQKVAQETSEQNVGQANKEQDSDNFDKFGQAVASSSRAVYGAGKSAYQYATSEEAKEKMSKAWNATKNAASDAKKTLEQKISE